MFFSTKSKIGFWKEVEYLTVKYTQGKFEVTVLNLRNEEKVSVCPSGSLKLWEQNGKTEAMVLRKFFPEAWAFPLVASHLGAIMNLTGKIVTNSSFLAELA